MDSVAKIVILCSRKSHSIAIYFLAVLLTILSQTYCESSFEKKHIYDFSAVDITGRDVSLREFKGKVLLIVNVATYCGFTQSHYKDLVKAQDMFGQKKKFAVLAFPCNQFGEQEPDTNDEIYEFLREVYKVNFPIFSKIEVTGKNAHPLFQYLKAQSGKEPTWNFWKYLIDHKGKLLNSWGPMTSTESIFDDIKSAIEAANISASLHSDEL